MSNFVTTRRHERRVWHSEVRVVEGKNILAGETKDICESGVGVVLTHRISAGKQVKIELPKVYKSATMVLNAVVRHQSNHAHGLEFVSLTDAQQHILRQLLKDKKSSS